MSERNRPAREPQAEADGVIEGRNAVTEALRAGTAIDKIFILKGRDRLRPRPHRLHRPGPRHRGGGCGQAQAGPHEPSPTPTRASSPCAAVREYASVDDILARRPGEGRSPPHRGVRRAVATPTIWAR